MEKLENGEGEWRKALVQAGRVGVNNVRVPPGRAAGGDFDSLVFLVLAFVVRDRHHEVRLGGLLQDLGHCPGRKTSFFAVKRPARPYKSAVENRFA